MEEIKKIKREMVPIKRPPALSQLAKIVSEDKQLNDDRPRFQLFLTLANFYDSDLKQNLNKTSFELDDKYTTNDVHAWFDFKSYSPVRKYITQYLDEEQLSLARKTLSLDGIGRTTDAINVQAIIEGKQKADQNTNIIVFFMPQKEYDII